MERGRRQALPTSFQSMRRTLQLAKLMKVSRYHGQPLESAPLAQPKHPWFGVHDAESSERRPVHRKQSGSSKESDEWRVDDQRFMTEAQIPADIRNYENTCMHQREADERVRIGVIVNRQARHAMKNYFVRREKFHPCHRDVQQFGSQPIEPMESLLKSQLIHFCFKQVLPYS